MSLPTGVRLGPYEITGPLGAGGMGEVYKARDTRLDRTVAIKILSEQFAADPERRERFEREARAVAALSHPHICHLNDIGDAPDPQALNPEPIRFLVMEYLEGQTLADRLVRGPLPPGEALRYAVEIADALDHAHRRGLVHRDLKPANVMLTKAGAKLLDFGLSKLQPTPDLISLSTMTISPAAAPLTVEGAVLGTFPYMSPEQLAGGEADARSDIFAFGAVLYEMATGRRAFEGTTAATVIGAILHGDPPPPSTLQPLTPLALDRIISRCLAKDPDDRWQTARDLTLELKWVAEGAASAAIAIAPGSTARASRVAWVLAAALGLAAVLGGVVAVRHLREAPAEAIQFNIFPPNNSSFTGTGTPNLAVSPDGRHVVFLAASQGSTGLWLRSLGSLVARPLPGTELATYPFWSPDNRFVGFFAGGKLKTVQIAGGPPIVVCDAPTGRGGTWNRDNVIVFAPTPTSGLQRVPATGGIPTPLTTVDTAHAETAHRWPHFLPDGRHFLYLAVGGEPRPFEVKVGSLDSQEVAPVVAADSLALYASGHLLFWRGGSLMAQPFDADARQVTDDPFPVAERVARGVSYASFSVSPSGVLAYSPEPAALTTRLTWLDRGGKVLGTAGDPGAYFNIALAPDETRVAASVIAGTPPNRDIWVIDLARPVSSRITFDPVGDGVPIWSPDSSRIVFQRTNRGLYQKAAGGLGPEELLLSLKVQAAPTDQSRNGRFIVYTTTGIGDLWVLPLADRKPLAFLQTPFTEDNGAFSPDGHWMAYSSDETGRLEVYVQPFPATGGKYQISKGAGGTQPMWRSDGKELFFLTPDGMLMAAAINARDGFEAGVPKALFATGVALNLGVHQYAVSRDGQRFLVNVARQNASSPPLTVVVNWLAAAGR